MKMSWRVYLFHAILTLMADDTRVGPAGWVLATNIRRVREAQNLTYGRLATAVAEAGRRIPVLGLRKIESCERRVDFDELLVLAYVLKVCPVDLMVPRDATDEPYAVTPEHEFESNSVREWIRGEDILLMPVTRPEDLFSDPGMAVFDAIKWMPKDRARRVARHWGEEGEDQ
jgi:hypothetical protein